MQIEYGVQIDDYSVRFINSTAALRLNRSFIANGRIQAFRKALKFITWLFRDDPEMMDEALSALEFVTEDDGHNNQIMDKHIEAINMMRRKYGIQ